MAVKESELIVDKGVIYHLGLKSNQLASNIIMVGDPMRVRRVASLFDKVKYKAKNREFITRTGTYHGMPVTVIGVGIGTDNTEIGMVECYGLREFNLLKRIKLEKAQPLTVIRDGTSGGPQRDVDLGSLALSTYALGLDNTGLFYQPRTRSPMVRRIEERAYDILTEATPIGFDYRGWIRPYASEPSYEVVQALMAHLPVEPVTGITAAASGFFGCQGREIPGIKITIPKLQKHLAKLDVDGKRVVNFEMESSLLCQLGNVMGYKAGSVCVVIANRPKGQFLHDYNPHLKLVFKGTLDAMLDMYDPKNDPR